MNTGDHLAQRARALARELMDHLHRDDLLASGGEHWVLSHEDQLPILLARVGNAFDFLSMETGHGSEWFGRARAVWKANGGGESLGSGAHAIAQVLEMWADEVERGQIN